jgi:hypothetical protein
MKTLGKLAFVAAVCGGAMALSTGYASARIVCNDDGDCWHAPGGYDYPHGVGVVIHPDDWKWKEGDHYRWHEHEGRGYWHGGVWVGIP